MPHEHYKLLKNKGITSAERNNNQTLKKIYYVGTEKQIKQAKSLPLITKVLDKLMHKPIAAKLTSQFGKSRTHK